MSETDPPPCIAKLSLHDWTQSRAAQATTPIRQLENDPRMLKTGVDVRFSASVHAMLHWCRINEQLVIERHGPGARIFAGFERMSRVKPVLARYRRLAKAVGELTVLGQYDELPDLDARLVDVGDGPMAREWFLLIDSPTYRALLVARDQDGFGQTGPLHNRRFSGMSLHNSALVAEAAEVLEQNIHRGTPERLSRPA